MTKIQTYAWVFLAITFCQIVADENPIKTEKTVTATNAHKDLTGLPDTSVKKADPKNSAIDSSLRRQVKLLSKTYEDIEDLPIPPLQSNRSNTAPAKNKKKLNKIRRTTKKPKVRPTRRIRPRPIKKNNKPKTTVRRNITAKLRIGKKLKPIKTTNLTISTEVPVSMTAFDIKRAQTRKASHYKRKGVFGRRNKKENTLTASKNATNIAQ